MSPAADRPSQTPCGQGATTSVPDDYPEVMDMGQVYEVEGVLEGDRVIRLKEPIP